jgi:signal transduction histidine kinase
MKNKAREAFERIRNRKNKGLGLRFRLVILVCAEIVSSVLFAIGVAFLVEYFLPGFVAKYLVLVVVSLILLVGIVATTFISKHFFDPIIKMGRAMEKVADGDFTVQLETKSSAKEIQEIYSGFNMMTQELSATEVLQTDFVSNVSHEFKTPINAIEGYATLLQGDDALDGDRAEYVEKILYNTKRISDLVGSILLLSKIENQSIPDKQTKFRLDEQIRQSILALEGAWSPKEVEFDVDLESVEYVGNEVLLRHVWDNLISNAIKFGPRGGLVTLKLKMEDGKFVFTVEDEGPGLTDEAKKHIFDKFYQGDSSHKQEGNGLGLALVKRILHISGGEISAENITDEGGCRFTVVLEGK